VVVRFFLAGFSDELVKLAGESSGLAPLSAPAEAETFKGKPNPLEITPKKDIRQAPQQAPKRQLVSPAKPPTEQPRPEKPKPILWDKWGARGIGLRVPF
jgi:hypothetical protein